MSVVQDDIFSNYLAELSDTKNYDNIKAAINMVLMMGGEFFVIYAVMIFKYTSNPMPLIFGIFGIFVIGVIFNYYTMQRKLDESGGKIYIEAVIKAGSNIITKIFEVVGYEYIVLAEKVGLKKITYDLEKLELLKGNIRDTIEIIDPSIYTYEYLEKKNKETVYNIHRIRNDFKLGLIQMARFVLVIFVYIITFPAIQFVIMPYLISFDFYIRLIWVVGLLIISIKYVRKYFFYSEKDIEEYVVERRKDEGIIDTVIKHDEEKIEEEEEVVEEK